MSSTLHAQFIYLFAGLALFMFGMGQVSDFLQRLAANRVRELFTSLKDRQWLAITVGILLTILLQSSGAVTSMLVGLGSANVISLPQVMGVIVGTAIGSSITVQILSLNITQYGLPAFVVGFTFYFAAKRTVIKNLSGVLLGFGLVFWGLEMMSFGTQVIKESPALIALFSHMKENPLLAVIVSGAFTAFVHSSAVTISLAMSLAAAGVITLSDSMYWVFGANIGTTSTALMAAVGSNYVGRQVAWAHFFFKLGGVALFYFVAEPFADLVGQWTSSIGRNIANANTLLNVISGLIFYPLIGKGAQMVEKMFPRTDAEKEFGPEFIVQESYNNPALAVERARREVLRMGDIVLTMVRDSVDLFKHFNADDFQSIHDRDNQVDLLHREVKLYLVKFTDHSGHIAKPIFNTISYVSDLESIADVVEKGLLELAKKKQNLKLEFSQEGWSEIMEFHTIVMEVVTMSLSCFHLQDRTLAKKIIEKKREMRHIEQRLQESHYERLNRGLKETINTSSIHLEILSDLRRIVGLAVKYAYTIE